MTQSMPSPSERSGFALGGDRIDQLPGAATFESQDLTMDPAFLEILPKLTREQPMPTMLVYLSMWATLLERLTNQAEVALRLPAPKQARGQLEISVKPSTFDSVRELVETMRDHFQASTRSEAAATSHVGFAFPGVLHGDGLAEDCDIYLEARTDVAGYVPCLKYNTQVYTGTFVSKICQRLTSLSSVWLQPETRIADLDILLVSETNWLLNELNDCARDFPMDMLIQDHVSRWAKETPQALAMTYGDISYTYQELNEAANRLAHYLREEKGVGVEDVVGLLAEPSEQTIIALLGILKAGAIYLPIDPDYPESRIGFMLEDAKAKLLLTTSDLMESYLGTMPLLVLDFELEGLQTSAQDPQLPLTANNMAYIDYTSGSTGRPKGVCITHRAVNRLVCNTNFITLTQQDRVAQASNLAFDAATFEIWGPLTQGSCLVGIPRQTLLNPRDLGDFLKSEKISVLFLTTALVNTVSQTRADAFNGLRCLLFGGQAVDPRWIAKLRQSGNRAQILHVYGPTESTTYASWYQVGELTGGELTIPIGGPLANTSLYVLDHQGRLVPAGVPGELYIGGQGLARGYWQRAGLTADRFVPHSFAPQKGERLYRTGDKVCRDHRGDVIFMGRFDNQVKVRGFRIEIGEVTAAIVREPAVADAFVLVRELEPGQKDLVAFVLAEELDFDDATALRQSLGNKLPAYMIPAHFIFVDKMPLTVNGKIDKDALNALIDNPVESETADQPTNPVEQAICEAFAEIMGRTSIGLDDNFFEVGGDSLRAIRVLALLQEKDYNFSIETLFTHATARELAASWDGQSHESAEIKPFALISEADRAALPEGLEDAFAPSRLQLGMLYHGDRSAGEYQDLLSYELQAVWRPELLQAVIADLFERHPILRASFDMEGFSQPMAMIHKAVETEVTVIDLRERSDYDMQAWREAEKRRPFVWEHAPLMRVFVHLHASDQWTLSLSLHHVLVDGWSVAGLFAEVFRDYGARLADQTVAFEPIQCHFREFIALEQTAVQSEETRQFWQNYLAEHQAQDLPRLPGPQRENRQGLHRVVISDDLIDRLQVVARLGGCQLKQIMLAAHMRVLALRSGSHDVITGLVSNGRPEVTDGDRVAGLFLNTIPFRVQLNGGNWLSLVREVRRLETEIMPHRRFPLPEIIETIGEPLFQHAFNYIDFHRLSEAKQLENLTIRKLHVDARSHFDVACNFGPSETGPGFALVMEYNQASFRDEQMEEMGADYLRVLEAMAHNPLGEMATSCLLANDEQKRIAGFTYAASGTEFRKGVHHLIAAIAREQPDQEVLVHGECRYTRAELERRAEIAAIRLQKLGVRAGTAVGLFSTPSDEAVIALLAIWKAGGTQVPMDPKSPSQRIQQMVAVAKPDFLLARSDEAPLDLDLEVVTLESLLEPGEEQTELVHYENEHAYVMFTSGSTGVPKGVRVFHYNIVRLLNALQEVAPFSDGSLLACAPLAFDASTFEIWGPLVHGGCTVVYQGGVPTVAGVGELIRGEQIKWIFLTSGLFHAFVEEDQSIFAGLNHLLVGGDVVSPRLFQRVMDDPSLPRPINAYGPTEATSFTTFARQTLIHDRVPIGSPLADTATYVLDQWGHPAPVGTPGLLFIGGYGLAEGYVQDPVATADKWRPDPFAEEPGQRMYNSGDMARWLQSGDLDIIGRIDAQVKINGIRMELGEIETELTQVAGIQQALVLLATKPEKHLQAFYTGEILEVETIKAAMARRLPTTMIPNRFTHLDSFPTNANGKVDRKALLQMEWSREDEKVTKVADNPFEQIMIDLWSQLLQHEVGLEDNFFSLGGNSIQATRLIARMRKLLDRDVPLAVLFENPTPSAFARALQELEAPGAISVDFKAYREGADLLSYSQRRMWFLTALESEQGQASAYNVPASYRLSGDVNVAALQLALQDLVARHDMLRTTFPMTDGEPMVMVQERLEIPAMFDLSNKSDAWAEVLRLNEQQASLPYDLESGPLFRVQLVKWAESGFALLMNLHHILVDGWALDLLQQDLSACYQARCEHSELPSLTKAPDYRQFARWQESWLASESMTKQLAWWQDTLADVDTVLELPTARPRPKQQSHQGAFITQRLNSELAERVKSISLDCGVTPFITLLSAYQVLLSRLSGQDRFCVGTPIAGRDQDSLESVIGCFINSLALRADLSTDMRFTELLVANRKTCLDAFARSHLPFECLVENLDLDRDLSRSPLFQTMFVFQNTPGDGDLKLHELSVEQLKLERLPAKVDLSLTMVETEQGLSATWVYNSTLFEASSIEHVANCFESLLTRFTQNGDLPVRTTSVYDQKTEQAILARGRGKQQPKADADLISQWEALLQQGGDDVALFFEGQAYTRLELDRKANRLANLLRQQGIREGDRVAICLARSAELITSLLAILKCGAAYAPLDPEWPKGRLTRAMEDCGASLVITQNRSFDSIPQICLTAQADALSTASTDAPSRWFDPTLPAYLICTSGSTGRAKAVVVSLEAIANYTQNIIETTGMKPGQRLAMVSTVAADLGHTMLFPALFGGGELLLLSAEQATDPLEFAGVMALSSPDWLKIVPSHLAALLSDNFSDDQLPSEGLLLGGEACDPAWVQRLLAAHPKMRVFNHYGPTEATVGILTYEMTGELPGHLEGLPLNRPLGNSETHILDHHAGLVVERAYGELCLGGVQLANGYYQRPALTAAAFIPNPFTKEPGARLYRGGDLFRRGDHGYLEFAGRVDDQVKIRGYRVEPGEVASCLKKLPGVAEAACLVVEGSLHAYVVSDQDSQTLKTQLSEFVPSYMIPESWALLTAMPLTTNGKVDRKALAQIETEKQHDDASDLVLARNPLESVIATIWADALGLEHLGVFQNYFSLGGHSLLAIKICARLSQALDRHVRLQQLFEHPTVADLAAAMNSSEEQMVPAPISFAGRADLERVPLSFAQEQLWFHGHYEQGGVTYNMPEILHLKGDLNEEALRAAVNRILERHEVLRYRIYSEEGKPWARIEAHQAIALVPEPLKEAQLTELIQSESRHAFDLEGESLVRFRLVRLHEDHHVLIMVIHHILFDGLSLGIYHRELMAHYTAFSKPVQCQLEALPLQFADYALWQREMLRDEALNGLVAWWQDHLNNVPPVLDLPLEKTRPRIQSFKGSEFQFDFDTATSEGLLIHGKNRGLTPYLTLFGVWQAFLYLTSGQERFCVGTPVAGRNHAELEDLLGCFVNTLPIRADFTEEPNFNELLAKLRSHVLGAFAHSDLPFEKLVVAQDEDRDPSYSPVYQVTFSFNNVPEVSAKGAELDVRRAGSDMGTAKFDLSLIVGQRSEGLHGCLQFNAELFDRHTAQTMMRRFQSLARLLVQHPTRPISEHSLISEAERQSLLHEWQGQQKPRTQNLVHQLLERQAEECPDAVAMVYEDQSYSFAQLNGYANTLASELAQQGVNQGMRVVVCLERSPQLLVAFYALFKLGAAYVPVDPNYPAHRVQLILEDAQAPLAITDSQNQDLFDYATLLHLLDEMPEQITAENPSHDVSPLEATFLIYTSGSTGKPKGHINHHAGISNYIAHKSDILGLTASDKVIFKTTHSFDASVIETFVPLSVGAGVVIAKPEGHRDPSYLAALVEETEASHIQFPPSMCHLFLDEVERKPLPGLRGVICSGEELTSSLRDRVFGLLDVSLFNVYGPSECAVGTVHWRCTPEEQGRVPIGLPVDNGQVYVLNSKLQLVVPGGAGELYLAGTPIGRGYYGHPSLTAERYIPNPFANHQDSPRLYRTGDLVRHRRDGVLEYLGRADRMLKVHGIRIEPGEIAACIRRHEQVLDVHVMPRVLDNGRQLLVAWYTSCDGQALEGNALRAYTGSILPEFMIPNLFIHLATFPLNPNGKIDATALPDPQTIETEETSTPPRTPTEQRIADIFAELLEIETPGIEANFFTLGGNSLVAVQVITRLREAFAIDLSVMALFNAPTIEALAESITQTELEAIDDADLLSLLEELES